MEEQVLNYVVFRVRGMLELLKGREKAIPDLKLSFLPSLYEWMKASGLFSFADTLRCLIVVLYVLNVGVLYIYQKKMLVYFMYTSCVQGLPF